MKSGYPPRGVPNSGYPPPPRGGLGTPPGGVPKSGYPPGGGTKVRVPPPPGGGGVPDPGRTTEGVTTRRAVCLLRSRRNFLVCQEILHDCIR